MNRQAIAKADAETLQVRRQTSPEFQVVAERGVQMLARESHDPVEKIRADGGRVRPHGVECVKTEQVFGYRRDLGSGQERPHERLEARNYAGDAPGDGMVHHRSVQTGLDGHAVPFADPRHRHRQEQREHEVAAARGEGLAQRTRAHDGRRIPQRQREDPLSQPHGNTDIRRRPSRWVFCQLKQQHLLGDGFENELHDDLPDAALGSDDGYSLPGSAHQRQPVALQPWLARPQIAACRGL